MTHHLDGGPPRLLPGEDVLQATPEEVTSWITIYEELAAVMRAVIARAGESQDSGRVGAQLGWIERRLAEWRERHAKSANLAIDEGRSLTHRGQTVQLTRREAELLAFLLRHPRRQFTPRELAELAWHNPWLSDAQVRTYLMRVRRRLKQLGLDGVTNVVRSRGYGIRRSAESGR